jgi:serine/threonine protein phosphatase PrpC
MTEPAFPPIENVRVRAVTATDAGGGRRTNDDAHAFVDDGRAALAVIAHGVAPARSGRRAADLAVETCVEMFRGRTTTVLDDLAETWWKGEHGDGKGAARPRPYTALPIADRAALRERVSLLLSTRTPDSMGDVAVLEAETRSVLAIPERAFERVSTAITRRADERWASWEGLFAVAAAVIFVAGRAAIAHVGDCAVYRLHAGALELLTVPHTMRDELRRARPDATSGEIQAVPPGLLSRGLGLGGKLVIETRDLPLETGDRYLVLGSGLAKAFTEKELGRALERRGVEAATDLVRGDAGDRPGNLTAIAVEIL